jgi:putative flippase GtrA
MDEYVVELFRFLEQYEPMRFLGASGVSGAVFASVYFPLQWFTRVHYRKSLYIAFVPSLIVGFLLHKYFTFRVHGEHWVWLQMSLYTIKRFVFIRINEYVLIRLVERHGFNTTVGQIVVAVAGFALNYLVTKLIFSI